MRKKNEKTLMDKIIIRDLQLQTFVGVYKKEKSQKQTIILNIELFCDIRKAAESDKITHTVNYKALKRKIQNHIENKKFNLIESIAEDCAKICLTFKGVKVVKICVDKPGCLTHAKSTAVEIIRPAC